MFDQRFNLFGYTVGCEYLIYIMNEEKWFSKEIDADRFYTVIEDL